MFILVLWVRVLLVCVFGLLLLLLFFFFFFQAEDGIRDRDVTGVQTCALPISAGRGPVKKKRRATTVNRVFATLRHFAGRSEERRVGKECRSRWSPDQ